MSDVFPFDELAADGALLDLLGSRDYVGDDPLAGMLLCYAMACDAPSPRARLRPRRNRRAVIGAFASAAIILSGAGVAAAVSDSLPSVQQLFASGSHPGGLLGRLGTLLIAASPVEAAVHVISGGAAVADLSEPVLADPAAPAAGDPGNSGRPDGIRADGKPGDPGQGQPGREHSGGQPTQAADHSRSGGDATTGTEPGSGSDTKPGTDTSPTKPSSGSAPGSGGGGRPGNPGDTSGATETAAPGTGVGKAGKAGGGASGSTSTPTSRSTPTNAGRTR